FARGFLYLAGSVPYSGGGIVAARQACYLRARATLSEQKLLTRRQRIEKNEPCRYARRWFPGECSRTRCIRCVSARNRKEKSMSDNQTHSHTALLVMDVQAGIVARFAQADDLLKPINTAITAAHAAQIPV